LPILRTLFIRFIKFVVLKKEKKLS